MEEAFISLLAFSIALLRIKGRQTICAALNGRRQAATRLFSSLFFRFSLARRHDGHLLAARTSHSTGEELQRVEEIIEQFLVGRGGGLLHPSEHAINEHDGHLSTAITASLGQQHGNTSSETHSFQYPRASSPRASHSNSDWKRGRRTGSARQLLLSHRQRNAQSQVFLSVSLVFCVFLSLLFFSFD